MSESFWPRIELKIGEVSDGMKTVGVHSDCVPFEGLALASELKPFGQVIPKKNQFRRG